MSGQTTRRSLLAQAAALGAALAFGQSCANAPTAARTERRDLFPQGVASGDPAPDRVILWTRRAPDVGAARHRLMVEVAGDEAFADIVARGDVEVSAATDWTCRFLAAGLKPAREYWYRFVDEAGNTSRVGRTLTAPADSDDRPVRFAFVSCQDVTNGAMNAYRRMIYEDVRRPRAEQMSFVLHLGDFIYDVVKYPEDGQDGMDRGRKLTGAVRYPKGERVARSYHVPVDLEDYRAAYRSYLLDPELQDARARWPFVPVWDNHEFSWNGYQSQQVNGGDPPRPAQTLKVQASQAWYEYQPARVRKQGAGDAFVAPKVENRPLSNIDARGVGQEANNLAAIDALRIERAFRFGKNIDMILTDNRSFRAAPIDGANLPGARFRRVPGDRQRHPRSRARVSGRRACHAAHRRDRNPQSATQGASASLSGRRADGVVQGAPARREGAVEDMGAFLRHAHLAHRSAESSTRIRGHVAEHRVRRSEPLLRGRTRRDLRHGAR